VVTQIGNSTPLSEARVEASNWMTALTLSRKEIGEKGGVPPGASCSVAPDGKVTIQDAVARKTYVLAPYVEESLAPVQPRGPRVPAETVPRPSSVPPPNAEGRVSVPKPSDPPPAKSSPAKRTIAYDAKELGLAPPSAQPETEKAPSKKTIAYDAKELGLAPPPAQPETEKAPSKKTIAYDAKELGLAPPSAQPEPEAPKKKPEPKKTIAYDAKELGLAVANQAASQAEPEAPKKKPAPKKTIAYDARELGLAPPPAQPEPEAPKKKPAKKTIAYDARELGLAAPEPPEDRGWELLHERDEEPTKETPLCYRERTFVVPQGTHGAIAEAILMARFDELKESLADRPKGKLVNMAVFDHRWDDRPQRPPLITLQWKDWRGDPIVKSLGAAAAAAAATTAPMSEPPAPEPAPAPQPAAATPSAPPQSTPPQAAPPQSTPPQAAQLQSAPPQSTPPQATQPQPTPPQAAQPQAAPAPQPAAPQAAPAPISQPPAAAPVSQPPAAAAPVSQPPAAVSQPPAPVSQPPAPVSQPTSDDRLATAFEALQDLFFLTTPVEGLDFVLELLGDLVPSEASSACLYDINSDELRFVALRGPGAEERQGEGVPRLSGLMGAAATRSEGVLLTEDVPNDARFDPGVDGRIGLEPVTMALVPVSHQGRLLGMLQLINRRDQAQYSRADANLMAYVGEKLAEFLYSARMRSDERRA